ncbi:cell wall hydrolase [Bacillus luteolus]|uniref:Cell wall hydrolase n=1 Tax=Litchfieldia luteola TaxID=682179 RepID=A0ABR9QM50_9BACI|nr:cell wall hydrolase [Cytobacillus luteolus]MBE4909581.1 cell wall hydrolase [Cytobacillus luteolus]MBP1940982.1 N-acetylmuramoyl-L-alanine amidase [Cytobacillus luteolus]
MKKLKKLVIASTLGLSLFAFSADNTPTEAATTTTTHTVKSGDTLWKLGVAYGVSVNQLKAVNKRTSNVIYPGQKLVIPQTITAYEKDLLARLVHAEAKGESYAGKVAVATVVFNRVAHPEFPNTIHGVITERTPSGSFAFTPYATGSIKQPADAEAKRAVEEAIAFRGQGAGSIYFYNPAKITNKWILSRQTTIVIGNHVFAK